MSSYYLGEMQLDTWVEINVNTHDPSTGAEADADSLPTYRVYKENGSAPLVTGTLSKIDDANTTGFYRAQFQISTALGFTEEKQFFIRVNATVNSITASTVFTFYVVSTDWGPQGRAGLLDEIKAKTDYLPADTSAEFDEVDGAIAGLNNLSAAQVKTEADQALVDYDPPTKAELDTAELNIRGADSDTLETLSDQMDSVQTTVNGISNVTRLSVALPVYLERPVSGDKAVIVKVALKDIDGNMEDPDGNQLALKVYNSAGSLLNSKLYKDQALTVALDAGTGTFAGYMKLVKVATGLYEFYYKVENSATEEELTFEFGWEEASVALYEYRSSQVIDAANDISAIKLQTDKLRFDGSDRVIADAEAISASAAAADAVEGNIGNLDQSIATTESNIRGTDSDDLKDVSDEIAGLNNLDQAQAEAACDASLVSYDPPTKAELDSAIAGLHDLSAAEVNAEADQALADYDPPTKAELDAGLAALHDLSAAEVNAEVDAALSDYDPPTKTEMDNAFAALNNLSSAEVVIAVGVSLISYDPPTKAEMDAGFAALNNPTAAAIADAVLTEVITSHWSNADSLAGVLRHTRALLLRNVFYDNTTYDENNFLTSMRMRLFDTKAECQAATEGGSGEGEFATLTISGTPESGSTLIKKGSVVQD